MCPFLTAPCDGLECVFEVFLDQLTYPFIYKMGKLTLLSILLQFEVLYFISVYMTVNRICMFDLILYGPVTIFQLRPEGSSGV